MKNLMSAIFSKSIPDIFLAKRFKLQTIFLCFILLAVLAITVQANAKELPLLLEVSELTQDHDGKRVAIMGWARSAETLQGRRGSNYVKTKVAIEDHSVTVFTDFPVYNVINRRVIVQGTYHVRGRYAGQLALHFIVAETLMRDWGEINGE